MSLVELFYVMHERHKKKLTRGCTLVRKTSLSTKEKQTTLGFVGEGEGLYIFQCWVLQVMLDSFLVFSATKDPTAVERANLLNMAKLSIKGLIESALSFGRTLDSDYPPLQQFFVVMEHCLKHGLKGITRFFKN